MPVDRLQRSLRATYLGLAANFLLTAGKFTVGFFGHSHALIADAVESLADIVSSIIVWRGLVVAAAPPDREHPYGHGKAEPIAAAIVSGMLLLAAGSIAVQSIHALTLPRQALGAFTLWVLIGIVVIKESLFRFVAGEADAVGSVAVHTDAWHHRSDAITSLAAAIGIAVTLVGGKAYAMADDLAALFAAAIIALNGLLLLRPALNELMDTSPGSAVIAEIAKSAGAVPGVHAVEKCIVRKTGYQYLVDMHVEVDPEISVKAGHAIAHQVKDRVREKIPEVSDVLVHIEPSGQRYGSPTPPPTGPNRS